MGSPGEPRLVRSARFVTLCFLYCGVVLLASQLLVYRPGALLVTAGNVGAALCILATGVYRLYDGDEDARPQSYGLFTYSMAGFAVVVTALFVAGVAVL
jgi:heme O synthase-like polyprenyltransferase